MKNQFSVIKYYYSAIVILSLLINGCINNSDYSEDLSGHYFYRDEGAHVKDILCHLPNHKEIYSEVIGYSYNKDFIVAAQKPIYKEYKTIVGFNLRSDLKRYPTNSKEEVIQSEKEADSILKHDPFYLAVFKNKLNYWIISNTKQELYGPLTKNEYKSKRTELMVPESLQIEYFK